MRGSALLTLHCGNQNNNHMRQNATLAVDPTKQANYGAAPPCQVPDRVNSHFSTIFSRFGNAAGLIPPLHIPLIWAGKSLG